MSAEFWTAITVIGGSDKEEFGQSDQTTKRLDLVGVYSFNLILRGMQISRLLERVSICESVLVRRCLASAEAKHWRLRLFQHCRRCLKIFNENWKIGK